MLSRSIKDPDKRSYMCKCFGKILQYEVRSLCSDNKGCVLLRHNTDSLKTFNWDDVIRDGSTTAPTLLYFIQQCMPFSRENNDAIAGFIISILMKQRRATASMFQRIVSILLYNGHCTKKVIITITIMIVCMVCMVYVIPFVIDTG